MFDIDTTTFNDYLGWLKLQESPGGKFNATVYGDASKAEVPTIGYGHTGDMAQKAKMHNLVITQSQADSLLIEDLKTAHRTLLGNLTAKGKQNKYHTLDDKAKLMLLDYTFNTGNPFKTHPKMTNAVLKSDWDTVANEFGRGYEHPDYTENVPLLYRNESTYDFFIKDRPISDSTRVNTVKRLEKARQDWG